MRGSRIYIRRRERKIDRERKTGREGERDERERERNFLCGLMDWSMRALHPEFIL